MPNQKMKQAKDPVMPFAFATAAPEPPGSSTSCYVLVWALCLSLIAVPKEVLAASPITGSFSSFQVSERSGDLVGMELHVVPNPTGYSVVVHASEGAPAYPESYAIQVSDTEFTFELPDNTACGLPPGSYRAKVLGDSVELIGPYKTWTVPRRQSYWQ